MPQFVNSYMKCLFWLMISEILCFILTFSFAIINLSWVRYVSLVLSLLAHILLMGNCGITLAKQYEVSYRRTKKQIHVVLPFLLSISTAIPLWLEWFILSCNPDSVAVFNIYLLLQAPFIQIDRLLTEGSDTFSELSNIRRFSLALPPLITVFSIFVPFMSHYQTEIASENARNVIS